MPRVLRIINRLNLGGPTYNAAYLTKYLAPEFETMLVSGIKEDSEESSEFIVEQMGLKPVYIPEMRREINFNQDRAAYRKIKAIIKDFRPDIVHTHAAKAGTLGRLAASSMGVPVIIHTFHGHVFHSYFSSAKTFVFKMIERYLSSVSTCIIAISDLQKKELCEIHRVCNQEKTVVIPLGFDLSRFQNNQEQLRRDFRAEWQISDDTMVVGIVGRIVPIKNHSLFVKAFNQVKKAYPGKLTGVIVGDGEDRMRIQQLTADLGLTISTAEQPLKGADIIFTSWIKDVERPLAGFDIVAMTSLNEGTPVSLIEAQAASRPILTTEVGGIGDVVIPGTTALLSPSDDINSLSGNIIKLLGDNSLRSLMQQSGWSHVKSRFHFTRLVSDTRELYLKLLEKQ